MAKRDHFAVMADGRGIESRQNLIAWCSACAKPVKLVSFAEAIVQIQWRDRKQEFTTENTESTEENNKSLSLCVLCALCGESDPDSIYS